MRSAPALLLVPLLVSSCSGGSSSATRPSPTGSRGTTASPTTTPPGEDPAPAAPVVTGAGSRFTPPKAPTTKTKRAGTEAGRDCFALADEGFTPLACRLFQSKLGTAVALVETMGQQERALVWTVHGTRADLALRAVRTSLPADGTGSSIGATTQIRLSDLAEDSTPKAVLLSPRGSDYDVNEAVDVVEASGRVVIHRDLNGGNAGRAPGGGLETVVPTSGGRAVQTVIQYRDGAWRITGQRPVPADSAQDLPPF